MVMAMPFSQIICMGLTSTPLIIVHVQLYIQLEYIIMTQQLVSATTDSWIGMLPTPIEHGLNSISDLNKVKPRWKPIHHGQV